MTSHLEKSLAKVLPGLALHPGPEKTLDRIKQKGKDYVKDLGNEEEKSNPRWVALLEHAPNRRSTGEVTLAIKCYGAILDYCRCSVTCKTPDDLVNTIAKLKKSLDVVGTKNGYSPEAFVPPSGYRDAKVIVRLTVSEDIMLQKPGDADKKEVTVPKGTAFLCEIQLVLEAWVENKKASSLHYKLRRAKDFYALASDFQKYLGYV